MLPPRCCGGEITLAFAGDFLDGSDSGSSGGDSETVGLREQYIAVLEKRTADPVFCGRGCMRAPRKGETDADAGAAGRAVFILPEDIKEEEDLAMCSACGKGTCTLCMRPAPHVDGGESCGVGGEEDREEIRYTRLSGRSGWKCCGACGMMVSRDVGCSHVVCRYAFYSR